MKRGRAVGLARDRVEDVADEDERRDLENRVDERGGRVEHQQHVRLVDLLEPADRRPVERDAVLEGVRLQHVGRDGEMLPDAGQVGEAEIHHLDVGSHLQDVGYSLRHFSALLMTWEVRRGRAPIWALQTEHIGSITSGGGICLVPEWVHCGFFAFDTPFWGFQYFLECAILLCRLALML